MKKIIAYSIIQENTPDEVTEKVGSFMAQGYQPYGQLVVIPNDSKPKMPFSPSTYILQAVVKYED